MARSYKFSILFILIGIISFFSLSTVSANESQTAQKQLDTVWQQAQTSGAYEFRTILNQTIYPAPKITNAGKQPINEKIGMEGTINAYAETFNMTFWRNATFDPAQGIEMKVEDGQAYARSGPSKWEPVDGVTENFAPAGDPLNFLGGIQNVQFGAPQTFSLPQAGIQQQFETFTFDVDGTELAAYLRGIMEQQLHARGDLPAGMQLGENDAYRKMTGTGELWVSDNGLPVRLSLDMDMGETEEGERITAVITTEFTNFDTTLLETSFLSDPQTWFKTTLPTPQVQQQTGISLSLFLLFTLITLIIVINWQEKWVYKLISIFVILSMTTSPLFNGAITHAFYSNIRDEQKEQETKQALYEMQANAHETTKNQWNPNQNPLTKGNEHNSSKFAVNTEFSQAAQASVDITRENTPATNTTSLTSINAVSTSSTDDSDSDGLSDEAEEFWGTCAYPLGSAEYTASDDCTDVEDPTDSDGDGMSDGLETNQLNTFPDDYDSDGDAITDTLEVQGFYYNGQRWYLDPNESDTNSDGLSDAQECYVWYPLSEDFDPNGICPDTDGDGTPDVFDDDNDGDGIIDMDDLDSEAKGAEIYTHDNPFKLAINGLQTDKPTLVELQFRPTVEEHLTYSGLVLDWPSGDYEGQIQRALTTTFATTANEDAYSTDSNASYGDIKIFPMLEVYIPYSDGHYGNLPVNSTYTGISRTLGLTMSQWLDSTELDPYSITVVDADETSGDLVAYVPLSTNTSNAGDETIAFSAQMLYYPNQDSWGADHEFRITWIVQMITDSCIDDLDEDGDGDPDNEDNTECEREDSLNIIHYYEEEWELTGLSISEEHGYDAALIYEDPTQDPDLTYDDLLWLYGWNLTNMFVTGLDCDAVVDDNCEGDGERDVTLANLSTYLDEWATNESDTDLSYESVVNRSYLHSGYSAVVAMTDTVDILDTAFASYSDQTYPSILIASESTQRSMSLNSLDSITAGTITFDMTDVESQMIAGLYLSTFEYDSSTASWAEVDTADYLDYLTSTLEDVEYFQAEDETDDSIDEAEGKLIWAQSYYVALSNGQAGYVETGGETFYSPGDIREEAESIWEQTSIALNTLSGGQIAKRLAGAFNFTVSQALRYSSTISTKQVWASFKSLYSSANYTITLDGSKRVKIYSLSKYIPDDTLLFKITKNWSTRILGVSMALFLLGATLYLTSLFIEDETTAETLSIVGQTLIAVSTIVLVSLEIATILSKLQLIKLFKATQGTSTLSRITKKVKTVASSKLTSLYRYYAVTGLVVGLSVTWGLFAYQLYQLGWDTSTYLFDIILIQAIVGTIFELVLFVLFLFFPVGTIIVLVYTIIELIYPRFSRHKEEVQ